ncbi:DUF1232 domain-containing protein [Shewanella sp. JM162201]|uniref:DUF1232 domain-containing protein n=1 Tax=Shewanella jiangmenensis TaxID=2837387 RepID=A0ABS5V6C0_9GAMM|nr:DUF1232 domain-containing protein [Shewanella jiangmenensis]
MAENEYSENGFWRKVRDFARQAGREVIEKALWLYYAAQRPETPAWAKTVIFGALGYFITPVDAIPDLTPLMGFSDDLGALAAALTMVAVFIDDNSRSKAAEKVDAWFGAEGASASEVKAESKSESKSKSKPELDAE